MPPATTRLAARTRLQGCQAGLPLWPRRWPVGLDQNEQLVAKTRELVGDQVEMMLDCYMAFDVEYTVRLAERLRPYRLKWIEEYLIPEDLEGHVAVRERLPWQTLATGEHMYTPWPFRYLLDHRAVDILQPDIFWVGGLTACKHIAEMANSAGVMVCLHGGGLNPFGQHLTIAMPKHALGEFFLPRLWACRWRTELAARHSAAQEQLHRPRRRAWLCMDIPEEWLSPFSPR